MTLILKLDLDMVKMYLCTLKMTSLVITDLKHYSTDRQTDPPEIITYPHTLMIKRQSANIFEKAELWH